LALFALFAQLMGASSMNGTVRSADKWVALRLRFSIPTQGQRTT